MKFKHYLLIIALIVIDFLTKYYVSTTMKLHQSIEVIKDFFYINYCHNTGAAFSMLEGCGSLFVVLACIVCGYIIYYLNTTKVSNIQYLSLLLVVSGAIGNCIDRIRFNYVIDFLDFYIFGYDFPIFNFADCCITVGGILLILSLLFEKEAN